MEHIAKWVAVVDDEEAIRRSMLRLLRSAGIDALAFSGGASFLAALAVVRPACVILDVNMPDMSGLEVCERLSAARHDIPVVLMTGQDSVEMRTVANAAGVAHYLTKPVDGALLLAVIVNVAKM